MEGMEGDLRRGLEWMVLVLGVMWRGEGDCLFGICYSGHWVLAELTWTSGEEGTPKDRYESGGRPKAGYEIQKMVAV
jgi:hypothetical protein